MEASSEHIWNLSRLAREHNPIRVAVVEDDAVTRALLTDVIGRVPFLRLLGAFPDAESALAKMEKLCPDVVVMDIQLPNRCGITGTRLIKQINPAIQILMFTVFGDSEHIMEALKAGASGYIMKRASADEIHLAIVQVHEGGAPMGPGIARKIVEALQYSGGEESDKHNLWKLTSRESEILAALARGRLPKQIAGSLGVGEGTVRFHIKNIYKKLHVKSRGEAIVKYLK